MVPSFYTCMVGIHCSPMETYEDVLLSKFYAFNMTGHPFGQKCYMYQKGYEGFGPLGLKVLQKLCSESPLHVHRPGVYSFARANTFVEKNKWQTQVGASIALVSIALREQTRLWKKKTNGKHR